MPFVYIAKGTLKENHCAGNYIKKCFARVDSRSQTHSLNLQYTRLHRNHFTYLNKLAVKEYVFKKMRPGSEDVLIAQFGNALLKKSKRKRS